MYSIPIIKVMLVIDYLDYIERISTSETLGKVGTHVGKRTIASCNIMQTGIAPDARGLIFFPL
jgi:hypothetical protein